MKNSRDIRRFVRSTNAATTTEYGILGGLVAAVVIVALLMFGPRVSEVFGFASDEIVLGSGENPIEQRSEKPDPFAIPPKQVEEEEVLVESDTVRLRGYNVPIPVAVSGEGDPEIKVGTGAWSPATTLLPKTPFQVRLTSGPMDGSAREATVDANGVTGTFLVSSADITPDTFSFEPQTGIEAGASIYFPPVVVTGITAPAPVSAVGDGNPAFSVDGGAFGTEGTIEDGQPLELRLDGLGVEDGGTLETQVFVGTVSATASATMKDTLPDAFVIAEKTDVTPSAVTVTGFDASIPVSVSGDGNPLLSIDGGPWTASGTLAPGETFRVRLTSSSASATTSSATVTAGGVSSVFAVTTGDAVPNAFVFAPATAQPLDTQVASSPATVTGLGIAAPVSVSGDGSPRVSVNGGAWVVSGTVTNGQTVAVRLMSASSEGETRTATVDIGGVTADFDVTTADATPDAFVIAAVNDADFNTYISSAAVTPSGFDTNVTVSLSGHGSAEFRVDNGSGYGAWRVSPASLVPGGQVQVRLMSDGVSSSARVATLTVGGVSANFTVTTGDATPNAFAFASLTAQPLNTLVTSSPVTITGLGIAAPVNVMGDGNPQISVNGGGWTTSGTVSNGQSIRVRLTTANTEAANHAAMVDIGGVMGVFVATTIDATPEAFAFVAQTGVDISSLRTSNTVTVSGIDTSVPVTVTGAGSPQIQIAGGSWVTSGTISNGQTLRVRLTASDEDSTARVATVNAGGVTANFSVTTGDATPSSFSFASLSAQDLNSTIASSPVGISGINIATPVSVSGTGSPRVSINGGSWVTSGTVTNG